jgi:hypothetical protein
MSGKPKKPLEPLIPLDELKKIVGEMIDAPKKPTGAATPPKGGGQKRSST